MNGKWDNDLRLSDNDITDFCTNSDTNSLDTSLSFECVHMFNLLVYVELMNVNALGSIIGSQTLVHEVLLEHGVS